MAASLPFSSALHEGVLGGNPLRVLPPPPIPTPLEKHLGQLRSFYQSAPVEPTNGRFYRKLLANWSLGVLLPRMLLLAITKIKLV